MSKGKDPAFLFYDGDAARDVSHMNRLERGCYFDFIQAQKKFGPLTIGAIEKILGKDFKECWPAINLILTCDEDVYYISWLKTSIEKRQKYSEGRSENRKGSKQTKNEENNTTYVNHMVNENAIEDVIEIKYKKESENFEPTISITAETGRMDQTHVLESLMLDDIYIEQLQMTHRGKDIKQAFGQCYIHHSNAPNPPRDIQGWKQKLNTWLSNTRTNGTGKKGSDAISSRREAFAKRHSNGAGGQ